MSSLSVSRSVSRAIGVAASLIAVVVVSACSTSEAAQSTPDNTFVLNAFDAGNSGPLAVGKREGIFDKALAPLHAKINWVATTPGFSSNLKLFNAGQLDIAAGAYSPVVGALSKNVGVKIFAVSDSDDKDQSGIVVTKSSGITDVKGLVGKRIAVNPAAKGEYIALKALDQAGIPFDQVTRVPLQQVDAGPAFATGKVDAWASFLEPYQQAKANGGVEIATEESINSVDNTIIAARTEVLQKRPDVVEKYLEVVQQLTQEQRATPEKFENVFDSTGPRALTGDRLKRALALDARATLPRYPTAKDADDFNSVSALFVRAGVIAKPVEAQDVFFDLPAALSAFQKATK